MRPTIIWFLLLGLLLAGSKALAHPGSGIVVDREGNIYFLDTGSGVWKIDPAGKLTKLSGPAYHWMAIDVNGRLANVTLPHFSSDDATVTRVPENSSLLLSSDFPLTVGPDGCLYYPWHEPGNDMKIFCLSPSNKTTVVKTLPTARTAAGEEMRWRNGITVSADGSIYYSEDRAIRKITPQGKVISVVSNLSLPGCGSVPGVEPELGPYCRGLAVDSSGTVYVAATGCSAVLRITTDGKVATVLQDSSPWSPTAVALYGRNLYVLEYLHTANESRREWVPRVRKVSSDGVVTMLATIDRK